MVANSQAEPTAPDTTASGAARTQKRDVYVTGFGKFDDFEENPTTHIAKALVDHPKVTDSRVLEVSIEGCVEALAETYAQAEKRGRPCVILHFGLSAISRKLLLEQVGYNVADFRIPDERGSQPRGEIIHEGEPDSIETALPLGEMLKSLQMVNSKVDISTDPGRYICNYVYYRSLVWTKNQVNKGNLEHHALFVHVPELWNITLEAQMELASKIVEFVADL
ncbi:G protein-activated inward rectifier potassium channel 2 [Phytophthora boehmeriae]|uniref:G protein-activated inward rectifier potassium channel 2 n=1 Tax=Phytophthora boehmeriae TaxID=109152 RepID=A0A8T1WK91_9STRA|nr:G protein-activated inward rectifier potassium channel 2 [Phytophthora boehmeriae]